MQSTWQNPESGNLDPSEWDRSTAIPTNMAFSRKQPPQLLDLQPVPEDGAHKKPLVRCDSCLQLACGVDFRLLHPTTTTRASLSSPATLTLFSDLFLGCSVPGPVPRLWNCPPPPLPSPRDLLPATALPVRGHLLVQAWSGRFPVWNPRPGMLPRHSEADALHPTGSGNATKHSSW